MVEILRTNDLLVINVIESVLRAQGVDLFVADQHMAAEDWARRLIVQAGLASELRDG